MCSLKAAKRLVENRRSVAERWLVGSSSSGLVLSFGIGWFPRLVVFVAEDLDAEVEYDRCSGYIDEPEDVGVDELGEHLILETPALLARRISFSEEKANYYLFDGAKLDRRQFKLTGSSICSVATSPYAGELQLLPLAYNCGLCGSLLLILSAILGEAGRI